MKQLLLFSFALFALLFVSCGYDDSAIIDRIENLENAQNSKIATLQQQIDAINDSIVALEVAKVNLEERISDVQADADANAEDIAELQKAKTTLEERIATLQSYVDTELQNAKNWATATFATLEQYNALAEDVAELKETVDGLDEVLKNWVNEQLDGYYTIAEVDAALEALQNSVDKKNEALLEDIEELSTKVDNMKTELTEAYTTAIEEAINTNNGIVDSKIADAIAEVNDCIDSEVEAINARIDALEERIEDLEEALDKIKALDIEFDIEEYATCLPGETIVFDYIVIGGDEGTVVESFGDYGWRSRVSMTDATTGRIRVTAPETEGEGKIVVIVTSGAGGVCVKSLYFNEYTITGVFDTYKVSWEACTLEVNLKTNVDYEVRIPEDAKSWLSVADTRADLRDETLTFTIAENPEEAPGRKAIIMLMSEYNEVIESFEIIQKMQPTQNPIQFADQYVKKVCVEKFDTNGDGELSYLEASKVTGIERNFFGDYSTVVKSFDEFRCFENVKSVYYGAFERCSNLTHLTIPESVTSIQPYAFSNCLKLESITMSNSLTSIADCAFENCIKLQNITLPVSLTSIGSGAFYDCSSLASIIIPNGMISVGYGAFWGCSSLTSVTIPDSIVSIGCCSFGCCSSLYEIKGKFASGDNRCLIVNGTLNSFAPAGLTEYAIPDNVVLIGDWAFCDCSNLECVIIPEGVASIGYGAFQDCANLESITIPNSVLSIENQVFYNCYCLMSIFSEALMPPMLAYDGSASLLFFDNNASGRKIYVPMESVEVYKSALYWSAYADAIVGYNF